MKASLDNLEFELRRIPGVVSVGFTGDLDSPVLRLLAPVPADIEEVRREANQLALTHLEHPIAIEVDANEPDVIVDDDSIRSERVRLLAVTPAPQGDEIEVHLSYGELRTIGRASSITLAGAAEATLAALDELGVHLPFQVKAATPLGASLSEVVIVVLDSDDSDGERLGIASGEAIDEATARATLHALNRFLADPIVIKAMSATSA